MYGQGADELRAKDEGKVCLACRHCSLRLKHPITSNSGYGNGIVRLWYRCSKLDMGVRRHLASCAGLSWEAKP